MPTSTYSQIVPVVKHLQTLMPTSVLDVGLGNGKLGFIARDLLDVMHGEKYRQEDWTIRVDGIEVFPDYIQAHQRALYDNIHIGDAFDVIDQLGMYEVIFLGDVLEHFEKSRAEQFLEKCRQHCEKGIILCIPLSERWTQEAIYDNPYERHLSFWSVNDFAPRASEIQLGESVAGQYGIFLMRREDLDHYEARCRADRFATQGKLGDAISSLEASLGSLPPSLDSSLLLVELLVRYGDAEQALERLRETECQFPEERSLEAFGVQLVELLAAESADLEQ